MKKALLASLALLTHGAMAAVINYEVSFTPFVGDIAKSHVEKRQWPLLDGTG